MEEKKKATNGASEELSYEQLKGVCHQLSEQTSALYQRLQEANMANAFKRLDYLFAVVVNKAAFPEDFVKNCVDEIVSTMTIPSDEENSEE